MSVSVNGPKTPLTKGSNGIAMATLPNICKMPGPPAPFIPAPLPNIGKTGEKVKDYSKKVKVEKKTVGIKGASFCSIGDVASKGTGGGMLSSNTHGPCKFISPGSMDVKFEGKNVHLLTDMVTNNGGPSGSPANAATMMGALNPTGVVSVPVDVKCPMCNDEPEPHGDFGETEETKVSATELVNEYSRTIEVSPTMIGVVVCSCCGEKYASRTGVSSQFATIAKKKYHIFTVMEKEGTVKKMKERFKDNSKFQAAYDGALSQLALKAGAHVLYKLRSEGVTLTRNESDLILFSRNPVGHCAAQKALVLAFDHNCIPSGMTEKWFSPNVPYQPARVSKKGNQIPAVPARVGESTGSVRYINSKGEPEDDKFTHGRSVPPCETCNIILPFLICSREERGSHPKKADGCAKCKGGK